MPYYKPIRAAALALAVSLVLSLALCGCSAKETKARPYAVEDIQTLLDAGVFDGEMEAVDGDIVPLLYGLDGDTVTDCAAYLATNTAQSADEVAVLVLADEAAAQAAETACQRRVADQLKVCQTYCPAAVPRLEGAVIDRVGNTVLLAVGDPETLPKEVEKLRP